MYDRILHDKLRFPPHVSDNARNLITELLVRDPEKRLGSKEDAKELTRHPFFEGIDWQKLYRREYKPPFNPGVVRKQPLSCLRGLLFLLTCFLLSQASMT